MRNEASVVVEFLGAVGNFDACLFADKLVVRALVHILKATPATDVKDQDVTKVRVPRPNILNQLN